MTEPEDRVVSKLKQEQRHFARLKAMGRTSLSVSDELTHLMLLALEDGFKKRYPTETDAEIRARMIDHVLAIPKAKRRLRQEKLEGIVHDN